MEPFLRERFGNPSEPHAEGRAARAGLDAARAQTAEALGTRELDVIFTGGGSEADNLAVLGRLAGGGRVVTTPLEHPAVARTLAAADEIAVAAVDAQGIVDLGSLAALIRPGDRLCAVIWASNLTGVIQPVREIAELCAERGVPLHLDAVQAAAWLPLRLDELPGTLTAALSGHKLHGPKGAGARGQGRLVARDRAARRRSGAGLRPGTESVAQASGIAAALARRVDDSEIAGAISAIRDAYETTLLRELPDVRIVAGDVARLPGHSLALIAGVRGDTLCALLDDQGFAVAAGAACHSGEREPSSALAAMGVGRSLALGALRSTFGECNDAGTARGSPRPSRRSCPCCGRRARPCAHEARPRRSRSLGAARASRRRRRCRWLGVRRPRSHPAPLRRRRPDRRGPLRRARLYGRERGSRLVRRACRGRIAARRRGAQPRRVHRRTGDPRRAQRVRRRGARRARRGACRRDRRAAVRAFRRAHGRRHVRRRRLRGRAAAHRRSRRRRRGHHPAALDRPDAPDAARACCSPDAVRRARATCHALGVPHITLDARDGFREIVVGPFLDDYQAGRTPNPCTTCNGDFRIALLADTARRLGAGRLATGHYARLVPHGDGALVARGADPAKDQSAMLARVPPELLGLLGVPARRRAQGRGAPRGRRGGTGRGDGAREPGRLLPGRRRPAGIPRSPRRRSPSRRDPRRRRRRRRPARGRGGVHRRPAPRARRRRRRAAVRAGGRRLGRHRHDRAARRARPARGRADRRHAAPPGLTRASAPPRAHGRRGGDGRAVRRGLRCCGSTSRSSPSRPVRSRCSTTTRAWSSASARSPQRAGRCRHDPPGVRARRAAAADAPRRDVPTSSSCAPRPSSSGCTSSQPAPRTARSRTTRTRSTSSLSGRGRFVVDGDDVAVGPGQILFVEKHAVHRFHSIDEDLSIVVAFSPPRSR